MLVQACSRRAMANQIGLIIRLSPLLPKCSKMVDLPLKQIRKFNLNSNKIELITIRAENTMTFRVALNCLLLG